jgi:integrase
LDKAGPPSYRNRDAAGIIPQPPWIRKPRAQEKPVRIVTPQELSDVYLSAIAMNTPRIPGFKPAAWWRALLVVAYNTSLRRRTLFEARMEQMDWVQHCLVIPAKQMKSRRPHVTHLNATAVAHLLKIRTDRELLFPWPHCKRHFDTCFHKLQTAAAIPEHEHFGLHDLRKTHATLLWESSPAAARLSLGHTNDDITRRHYVAPDGIVARALDSLQQPQAFLDAIA